MKTTTAMIPRCLCLLFSVGRPLVAGITDCVLKVWNCVTCNFLSVNSHEHTTWYLKLQPKNDNLAHWTKTSVRHLFNVHYSVTDVLKTSCDQNQSFDEFFLHAAKHTPWIPSLDLSGLYEAWSLPGEPFISFIKYHILVIQPSSGRLLFQSWITKRLKKMSKITP